MVWGSWCPWGVRDAGVWAEWGEGFGGSSPKEGQCLGWEDWAVPTEITPQAVCEELNWPQKVWWCPCSFPLFWLGSAHPCQMKPILLNSSSRGDLEKGGS